MIFILFHYLSYFLTFFHFILFFIFITIEGDLDQEEREREEALQRRRAEEEVSTEHNVVRVVHNTYQ